MNHHILKHHILEVPTIADFCFNAETNYSDTPGLHYKIPVFSDPAPGNLSVDSVNKWIPEQPSPWRKS